MMWARIIIILLYALVLVCPAYPLTPKTNRYHERGKQFADMAKKKFKEKSASIVSSAMTSISLPESISLTKRTIQDGKDYIKESLSGTIQSLDAEKQSISLLIADLKEKTKEKTGDISQMVRMRTRRHRHHIMTVRHRVLLSIRGGGTSHLPRDGADSVIDITNPRKFGRLHDDERTIVEVDQPNWIDEIGRKLCQSLAVVVGLQTLGTILSRNNFGILDEVCQSL